MNTKIATIENQTPPPSVDLGMLQATTPTALVEAATKASSKTLAEVIRKQKLSVRI